MPLFQASPALVMVTRRAPSRNQPEVGLQNLALSKKSKALSRLDSEAPGRHLRSLSGQLRGDLVDRRDGGREGGLGLGFKAR